MKYQKLERVIELISGQHVNADLVNEIPQGKPYLTGPSDFVGKYVKKAKYTEHGTKFCKDGDILITVKGSGAGTMAWSNGEYAIGRQLMAIRGITFKTAFLWFCLEFQFEKIRLQASGTIPGLSRPDINKIEVPSFPIAEQRKIAEILGTCDRQIELTEKLIEAKRKLKQGLTQKLLKNPFWNKHKNNGVYFIEKWNFIPLSKCFIERKETSSDIEKYQLYSLTIEEGLTEKTDRYNREFLLKNKEENAYRLVYPEDFLYNPMNLRFGAIAKSNLNISVAVSAYYNVLIPNSEVINNYFLLQILKSPKMIYTYNAIGKGSLVEKKRVHLSDFLRIKIPIPSLQSQQRFSDILRDLEQEENYFLSILNLLKQQKKGLMQQLLTGKTRVKVD